MLNHNSNPLSIITRYGVMFLVALFIVSLVSCAQEEKKEPPRPKARPTGTAQPQQKTGPSVDIHNVIAVIETAKGTMEVEFYPDDAPQTVTNFVKNAQREYYNNETFHRVEPGLLIQAGSHLVSGTMPIEQNTRDLGRGALVMVKIPGVAESDTAEFFICLDKIEVDEPPTIFGRVTKGIEVLNKIVQGDQILKIAIRTKG